MNTKTKTPLLTRSTLSLSILLAATLIISGCAVKQPAPAPRPPAPQDLPKQNTPLPEPPKVYTPKTGPAASLYQQANSAIASGKYRQAELALERALRIEPRNGHYWYSLAEVKFKQKQYSQAIQLSRKSMSLAGKDSKLKRLNDILIQKSRQQMSH